MQEQAKFQTEAERVDALHLLDDVRKRPPVGEKEVRQASEILQAYKRGKSNLESRIVEDELWYKLRH